MFRKLFFILQSTQIPQYIYEGMMASGHGEGANIVVTQPRRVAAMALADRVAEEHQSTLQNASSRASSSGKEDDAVAYQVRLDNTVTEATKITYCTVGILLRRLTTFQSSSSTTTADNGEAPVPLSDVTHLIIDEVHERSTFTDFLLAMIKGNLTPIRKNVKIIQIICLFAYFLICLVFLIEVRFIIIFKTF